MTPWLPWLLSAYLIVAATGWAADAPAMSRRLTHSQYNHTVRDLLGDQTSPASHFPREDFVNGFKNQAEAQSIPALMAENYSAAAEKLARNAFRAGDSNGLVPCKPRSADDADCRARFLHSFGLRAFRSPLTEPEFVRYSGLFSAEAKRTGNFLAAAQLVVEAMLQSPNFLLHVPRTRPYDVANRLSYAIWDSMPDQQLFQSDLATPEAIEKAARRMVNDPRAREAVDEFISQWLRFDRILNTVKDRRLFPQFNPELAASMTEETRRLIADTVWNDGNFMGIFSADYTFINSDLAALYKMPAPPEEFAKVRLAPESGRAGILGQAAFLALTSKPAETSPTARGIFVREQFLCQHVPDPPPGTNSNLPPLTEEKPQTNRERLAVHLARETCATCHRLIDPIGFGFEKFGPIGASREKLSLTFFPARRERNKPPRTVELDLDTTANIAGFLHSDFSSPRELGLLLAKNPLCQECVVKQLFRYMYGRPETPADRPIIESALRRFRESRFRFKELIVALASSYGSI